MTVLKMINVLFCFVCLENILILISRIHSKICAQDLVCCYLEVTLGKPLIARYLH